MKPEEFDKDVREGGNGPLYYLYGDEPYLIERGVKRLMARVVPPDFREFNLNVFYGGEVKGEAIMETAQTLPMFAERRVVLIKRSGALSPAALELLSGYVQDPCPSTCLIFQGDKIDQRKKFFLDLKKNCAMVEFKRPYDNQLGPFIREEATRLGKRIETPAIELLAYYVGSNLQELVAQMEKLADYAAKRETITVDDVRTIASDTKVDTVFDLANALGGRNLTGAFRCLRTLLRDGEAPLYILNMITRHFRQLWRVKELMDKKHSPQEISKAAGVHSFYVRGVMDQAKGNSRDELRTVFESIYKTDLALKSSGGKPADLMERLVLDLCGSGGGARR
jgi:DNA polymerase III subunit delta